MLNPLTNPHVHMEGSSWKLIHACQPVLELRQWRRKEENEQWFKEVMKGEDDDDDDNNVKRRWDLMEDFKRSLTEEKIKCK